MSDQLSDIKRKVQISIPFTMLHDTYLDRFLSEALNPEMDNNLLLLKLSLWIGEPLSGV